VIVPFGAGGNTDSLARIYSARLSARLGQQWSRLPPRGAELAIDEVMESATNEASRYKLRLRPGGCPVGIALALSWLWQDLNHEGVDPRRSL
jgi:tripartite-type tricarboxylate transporter receptor subunit TctC